MKIKDINACRNALRALILLFLACLNPAESKGFGGRSSSRSSGGSSSRRNSYGSSSSGVRRRGSINTYQRTNYNGFVAGAAVGYMVGSRRRYYYGHYGYSGSRDFGGICKAETEENNIQAVTSSTMQSVIDLGDNATMTETITTNTKTSKKVTVYWECRSNEGCCKLDCCKTKRNWLKIIIGIFFAIFGFLLLAYCIKRCCCQPKRQVPVKPINNNNYPTPPRPPPFYPNQPPVNQPYPPPQGMMGSQPYASPYGPPPPQMHAYNGPAAYPHQPAAPLTGAPPNHEPFSQYPKHTEPPPGGEQEI